MNSIADVRGIRVGHYQQLDPDASLGTGWACGVSVVLTPPGTVGAVDCRGGAPGTRETDLLDPASTVRFVDAGVLAVVNSAGDVVDRATGLPWMADLIEEFALRPPPAEEIDALAQLPSALSPLNTPLNTTIAVVATDAALSPAACRRVAIAAHDGLARTIRPAHTPVDGDTVFALATGAVEVPPAASSPWAFSPETGLVTEIGIAAADC